MKSVSAEGNTQMQLSRPTRGAWIEIPTLIFALSSARSRPTRGAWIEISIILDIKDKNIGRAPHGARGLKCLS